MAERVVLHLGTMKSGTTYLQSALMASRAELEAVGAFYVGDKFGLQSRAVRGVVTRPESQDLRLWRRLADEARERPGDAALFSMEFLSFARRRHVAQLLEPLRGLPVEVVLTVRDQFGALPAQWQSYTRNTGTDDWARYLRRIEAMVAPERKPGRSESQALRTFRRAQDAGRILDRWQDAEGVTAVRVVTVPPPGADPEELWRRFARAARVDLAAPTPAALEANASLGYASCEVMRLLNPRLHELSASRYQRQTRRLIGEALAPLRELEGRPALDRRGAELARELNRRLRSTIARDGIELVGTVDDLPDAGPPPGLPDTVTPPDAEEVLRAAGAAWEHCYPGRGADVPTGLEQRLDEVGISLVGRSGGPA